MVEPVYISWKWIVEPGGCKRVRSTTLAHNEAMGKAKPSPLPRGSFAMPAAKAKPLSAGVRGPGVTLAVPPLLVQ